MSKDKKSEDNKFKTNNNNNYKNHDMKKYCFFLAALLCMMVSTVCHADDDMVAPAQLPAPVKNFVAQHFKGKSIAYAELDREFAGGKYELHLNDGTELNFDRRGN